MKRPETGSTLAVLGGRIIDPANHRDEVGDLAVLDGAKAMALTTADLWLRPDALAAARDQHRAAVDGQGPSAL